ncbi:MAG: hypothetical protein QM496_13370 [Verrucomicrobiota bacterium]
MKSLITLILIAVLPLALSAKDENRNDWLIDPAAKVGKINKSTSEEDLIKIYGKENVKRQKLPVGEGMFVEGAVLFPGTKNELLIEWKGELKNPERITISSPKGSWRFSNGLKIGDSLEEVEKYNAAVFRLSGFEWDYPGRTTSWEKGKLSKNLQLDFATDKELAESDAQKIAGDGTFKSSNKVMKKMKLKVKTIFIRWD